MKFFRSIRTNLVILIALAMLPALAILFFSGMEQRRESIELAKRNALVLTHSMAQVQVDITRALHQLLATLALLPEVQAMDAAACAPIFAAILESNPDYHNLLLINLEGDVIAAGRDFKTTNLADRKHFREALAKRDFAVGEFIFTRVGASSKVFPFAYPVLDQNGQLKGVVSGAINLGLFARFHAIATLPAKGFISLTDNKGIRLFYYPETDTNPIGKPIKDEAWQKARNATDPGIFTLAGSDGDRRLFAFEQVRLRPDAEPYIYVWAGIPESYVLRDADAALIRNLLLMVLVIVSAFTLTWVVGRKTLLAPINNLISLTRKFAEGQLDVSSEPIPNESEFGTLTRAFHDMAGTLAHSQKILQESEARFRVILDSLDALVYVADMETYEILFLNEYGRRIFGDIAGETCWQSLQSGQTGPCSFCTNKFLLDEQRQPAGIYGWEFRNLINQRWYFIHDQAIEWTDGRIVRMEIATDITERKLAETRLAEESERLLVTLQSIADGVITTDTEGNIVLLNPVAEKITGWTQAEARQKPLAQIFQISSVGNLSGQSLSTAEIFSSLEEGGLTERAILRDRQQHEKTISSSVSAIRDENGDKVGVVLVVRDISEQLRTEQELAKIQKLESVGVLAGGIAHDFNNILAAILGNIDLTLRDVSLSDKSKQMLTRALNASFRARDLTQQLLTFAKGGEPIKESSSLAEVVTDSADFILRGDKVACRYHFPDDLWLVDIDRGQISQVVQNMIINAREAMPGGGIIEVAAANTTAKDADGLSLPGGDRFVKLTIRDSGCGIPKNILEKIFDPYFSTKQEGSGLGLAISHSIIKKHGGAIRVASTPGEGTLFSIFLPAAISAAASVESPKIEAAGRRGRILVVDDEELVRSIVAAMLEELGHEVLLAEEGRQAIALYRQNLEQNTAIDLMIMDLTIPGGMGGQEALQQILAIDPQAKAIVSSGYSTDPVMANFADYGFVAAINKPYQLGDMEKVINQLVG